MTAAVLAKLLAMFFTVALGWLAGRQGWLGRLHTRPADLEPPPADPGVPDGWEAHRRIRLRNFLAHMSRLLQDEGLQDADWDTLLPALAQHGYTQAEIAAAQELMQGLRTLGGTLQALPDPRVLETKAPRHAGRLRVTPVI